RVVVEEDEAVEAELELVGQLAQARRLVPPVDADRDEVLAPQHHPWVALEDLVDVGSVVLARDREEDSRAGQLQELALEILVREPHAVLAELDLRQADLADDAAPEDVVEVDGHDLAGQAARGGDVLRD